MTIPEAELRKLKEVASAHSAPAAYRLRVRMILRLAEGVGPAVVARELGCEDRTVRKWRGRWEAAPCLESLRDHVRLGAPGKFTLAERCEVVRTACDEPDGVLVPFRDIWTQRAIVESLRLKSQLKMSRSTVQRILSAKGLRPHRVRQWLHSPDPDFCAKVERICALYTNPPEDAVVLCIDEKPLQTLEKIAPKKRARDASVRNEYEYRRHGVGALLAAFDIRSGHVIGKVVERRDAKALVAFMDQVAAAYPDKTIYVVWDNLNIHHEGRERRWTDFNQRHGGRFHFVHTPIHASWVNQVEVWFSILQRRVIRYGSFDSRERLAREVEAFARYWNLAEAHPFRWKFSGRFEQTEAARAA